MTHTPRRQAVQNSRRAYTSLAQYAAHQGAPEVAYIAAGWQAQPVMHRDPQTRQLRPALQYQTNTGPRWRFIDGDPDLCKYTSPKGYQRCWYQLAEAVNLAQLTQQPLVICNGEAATVAAQHHGVAATSITGGETGRIPDNLLVELQSVWQGKIILALDCDATGQRVAGERAGQLQAAGYTVRAVDLLLGDKGDLADFCKVFGYASCAELGNLPTLPAITPRPIFQKRERQASAMDSVNWENERAVWWTEVVLPLVEQRATIRRGKHFQCINPHHSDNHPSARISYQRDPDGLYVCTCGAHKRRDVAEWVGAPNFLDWWKSERAHLFKHLKKSHRHAQRKAADKSDTIAATRYVSDDLTPEKIRSIRTLLIAAPTGMGKTRAVADYAKGLPTGKQVTGYAQYRLLTVALGTALDAMHYEDLSGKDQKLLKNAERLVSSISSASKFERRGGVVIADEIEGDLQFIVGSNTFKYGESINAWRAFKSSVMSAEQVIGMDAGLSEITIDLIRQWRGNDITVKRFKRPKPRGKVTLLKDRYAAVWQIKKLLAQGRGTIYVPCSSERDASEVADLFREEGYRVLKITHDTSHTPCVRAFIENKNNERGQYDLVVYTAAMGAGVDISEPVFAQIGIFHSSPLAPEQAIQLFGRVRNAQRYYAAVPPLSEGYDTPNAEQLIADRLKREHWTARQRGATPDVDGDYLEMLTTWAKFEARRRKETAHWRKYFASRLTTNGYTVLVNTAKAPQSFVETLKDWRQKRQDSDWQFIFEAQSQALPDDDLESMRPKGIEITRELKLLNIRYKIEKALGHEDVTDADRDLMNERNRDRHFNLVNILLPSSKLLATDREQAAGLPVQKRKYKLHERQVQNELFGMVGFTGSIDERFLAYTDWFREQRSAAEISERFSPWLTDRARELFKQLGHHGNNAQTIVGLCRWQFEQFGLKLNSIRHGRGQDRYMAYQLDLEILTYRLARARRAICTTNVQSQEKSTFVVHPVVPSQPRRFTPPGDGWRLVPPPPSRSAAYLDSLLRAPTPVNPFARAGA